MVIRILFVCHGNICRSPMAEFIMKDLIREKGLDSMFYVESCATSSEELGNDIYPPAKRTLDMHSVAYSEHRARRMTPDDYDRFDMIIAMDSNNLRNMRGFVGSDPKKKVSLMMSFAGRSCDVADPWYSGDFERTYRDLLEACNGLLTAVVRE